MCRCVFFFSVEGWCVGRLYRTLLEVGVGSVDIIVLVIG